MATSGVFEFQPLAACHSPSSTSGFSLGGPGVALHTQRTATGTKGKGIPGLPNPCLPSARRADPSLCGTPPGAPPPTGSSSWPQRVILVNLHRPAPGLTTSDAPSSTTASPPLPRKLLPPPFPWQHLTPSLWPLWRAPWTAHPAASSIVASSPSSFIASFSSSLKWVKYGAVMSKGYFIFPNETSPPLRRDKTYGSEH